MDTIADLYRRAHLIERELDDLDDEERMPGADLTLIECEREMLGTLPDSEDGV